MTNKEVMLFVRMGRIDPNRTGLIPFRICASNEEADNWIETHPAPGFSYARFEIITEVVKEGVKITIYDPDGRLSKDYGILSAGLYHQLKTGHSMVPESENN